MPSAEFQKAVEEVQSPNFPWDDEGDMNTLYGLYQQATVGDNNTEFPITDLIGRRKWAAWKQAQGLSPEEAEAQYIAFVEKLKAMANGSNGPSYASGNNRSHSATLRDFF